MNNILAFPQDRVQGRRVTMECEVIEFPARPRLTISFNPWLWWLGLSITWTVKS
jgi:hypothetical protein